MAKLITAFLFVFCVVFLTIQGFIAATGREKLQLLKVVLYGMIISVITLLILSGIVILF